MKNFILLLVLSSFLFFGCEQENTNNTENTTEETTTEMETSIVEEDVTYTANGVDMQGTIYYNENTDEKMPGILVVHEWWGHNEYSKMRARQLAELGYVGFAIDMYGKGKRASHPEDAKKFSGEVMQNFDQSKERFTKAMEVLQNNEHVQADQIGAIGYCFGGGVVLSMANTGNEELDGVVSFHGSLGLPVMPEEGKTETKVLVLNGADDPFITEEQINNYKEAMDEAGADYELINYENAKHAFTSPMADSLGQKFDLPLAYNENAAEQSWEEMKSFFNQLW